MQSVQEVYDSIISDYHGKVKSEILDHRFIERFFSRLNEGSSILDVGAGTGAMAFEMKHLHKFSVVAIDTSKEMVKFAKQKYPHIDYQHMDMRHLKFAPNSFNAIFANYSLIHILQDDVVSTLAGFHRVLKKNGLLYLSLQSPRKKDQNDGYYPLVYKKNVRLFINLFSQTEIKKVLKDTGFRILETGLRAPDKKTEFPFNKLFITAQKNSA